MSLVTFAQGSQHGVYLVKETTPGATPSTPAFIHTRYHSCNLGLKRTKIKPKEVRSDRAVPDVRLGNYNVAGDIGFELSFGGGLESLIEGAMGGTWTVAYALTAQTIAIDTAAKTLTRSAEKWGITDGVKAGDTLILSGCTTSANDGHYLIAAVTDLVLTYAAGPATTTEAGNGAQAATTNREILQQGATIHSYSIMRKFIDIAEFVVFSGCRVNKMTLNIKPNAVVEGTVSLVGVDMSASEPAGATYGSTTTTSSMDNFSAQALEDNVVIATLTAIDISLDNGVEAKFVVGKKAAANLLWGRSEASGKATLLFADQTMLEKFLNETESSVQLTLEDREGNAYRLLMNKVIYTSGDQNMSGEKEIPLEMSFDALHDTTYTNIQWEKIPVYAA